MTDPPPTPTDDDLGDDPDGARPILIALAICCTVPTIGIVVMTSVLGIALGWAAAIALGVVAAAVCVVVMAQHHRRGGTPHEDHGAVHDHHDT